MEINMKDKLRSLRQQKNITQETLANYLGITPQSVGKWERGEGFPDITLLPKLAFYFEVSIDELLGVDQIKVQEKIEEYSREAGICMRNGETEKYHELWERAYVEFPNDTSVMTNLMCALNFPNNSKENILRAISLGEKILEKSTESIERQAAVQQLCLAYNNLGDKEKALYYAEMGGDESITKKVLKMIVCDGEDGVRVCQDYIAQLVRFITNAAYYMTEKVTYPPEKAIEVYQSAIDIMKCLYSDGNFGEDYIILSSLYLLIAKKYAEMKDGVRTVRALEECRRYAIVHVTLPEEMDYTTPLVDRLKYQAKKSSKIYKGNACNLRLESLKHSSFDFIREDDGFKKIIADLEKHAEQI